MSEEAVVKLGIIGFGFMGHHHAENVPKVNGTKLIAVCDTNPDQLVDKPADIRAYTNADELLENPEINTVIIAVPNHLHLEMVQKAAAKGKHVICEKPAAISLNDFDEMVACTRRAGVIFTVHQQRRFDTDFQIAKEVYDSRTLGTMYTIQSKLYGFNGNMHDWHVYRKYGGGMLYDWGVHLIDQMLYMVEGKITSVFADVRNVINQEVDDYFKIILEFANGVMGEIELGTYFLADKDKWFERHWFIGGNTGSMYIDGFECTGAITRTTRLLQNVPGKITMTYAGPTRSFGPPAEGLLHTEPLPVVHTDALLFFENFVKVLQGQEELVVKPEEVRRVLALMNAVRLSGELHQSVAFEK